MGCFSAVHVAALARGDEPVDLLRRLEAETVVVVPMMMCAGWIAQQVLPPLEADGRGQRRLLLCDPLGTNPEFASLIQRRAEDHAALSQLSTHEVTLLLIAHGTLRNHSSSATTERHAATIRSAGRFRAVATAYLDQPPRIAEALAPLAAPIIAVGCFAAPGHHATHDVAAGLSTRPGDGVAYLGAIGEDAAVPLLLRRMVENRLAGTALGTAVSG